MRNNLIPTPITDKNGKLTTVHRRTGAAASKVSSLAGIKPSLPAKPAASANPSDDKIVGIKWKISEGSMPLSEGSFLDRAGLADAVRAAEVKAKGHPMTRGEVFEFMKHGITFSEAAALHQLGGPLENWIEEPSFKEALPNRVLKGTGKPVSLVDTMDFLNREGVTLSKVHKLVRNGLSDEFVQRSVLEPQEIISLFTRFSYKPSINPDETTNSAATMQALNEGLLPASLIDNMDADKSTMTAVLYALYPPEKKRGIAVTLSPDTVSESTRQKLINDPEKLSQVIEVMSKYSSAYYGVRLESIDDALSSINDFGLNACLKHHPNLLNYTLSNGKPAGPKRMDEAKATVQAVVDMFDSDIRSSSVRRNALDISIYKDKEWLPLSYTDIAEFKLMGVSKEEIFEKTVGAGLSSNRALAIAQNRVSPAVSSGWL